MLQQKPTTLFAVRGAFGFGLGALVMIVYVCVMLWWKVSGWVLPLTVSVAGFVSGAIGGAFLPRGNKFGGSSALSPAIGFGIGFVFPGFFGMVMLIGAAYGEGMAFGTLAWAMCLGVAGAIGSLSLRTRLRMIAGGLAFAIGGSIAGATAFALFGVVHNYVFISLLYGLAYVTGGTLLGAAIPCLESSRPKLRGGDDSGVSRKR